MANKWEYIGANTLRQLADKDKPDSRYYRLDGGKDFEDKLKESVGYQQHLESLPTLRIIGGHRFKKNVAYEEGVDFVRQLQTSFSGGERWVNTKITESTLTAAGRPYRYVAVPIVKEEGNNQPQSGEPKWIDLPIDQLIEQSLKLGKVPAFVFLDKQEKDGSDIKAITLAEINKRFSCTCNEEYKSRNLEDPTCALCQLGDGIVEIVKEVVAKVNMEAIVKWAFSQGWDERSSMTGVTRAHMDRHFKERIDNILAHKQYEKALNQNK